MKAGDCDSCQDPGACSTNCDQINGNNNAVCGEPGWTCKASSYGNGGACDCGCGVVDPDCADQSSSWCVTCVQPGSCAKSSCAEIQGLLSSRCN